MPHTLLDCELLELREELWADLGAARNNVSGDSIGVGVMEMTWHMAGVTGAETEEMLPAAVTVVSGEEAEKM